MRGNESRFRLVFSLGVLITLLAPVLPRPPTAQALQEGWLSGFTYRKAITIDTTNVDANLADFPLLVKISQDADIGGAGQADGDDIRFTSSTGVLLAFEEEDYRVSSGSGSGNFWVKVPSISAAEDTTIYVYYGSGSAVDNQDAANVWDSNYKAVWHLPDGSTLGALDSTSNNNDGTIYNATATTGKIDGAGSFDGSGDNVQLNSFNNFPTAQGSASVWVKPGTLTTYNDIIDFSTNPATGANRWGFERHNGHGIDGCSGKSNDAIAFATMNSGGSSDLVCSNTALSSGNWYNLVGIWDATGVYIYVNGIYENYFAGSNQPTSPASYGYIGTSTQPFTPARDFNGLIDEVRVSASARSAAWVKFEYNNMSTADNEIAFAAQETADSTPPSVSTLSPADNAVTVNIDDNLVITFDEAVDVGTGNITIKKSSDNSTVATIDVTSGQVTGTGTDTITINPSNDLDGSTGYYVQIDATAFDDLNGNSYAGIANTTTWNFTTRNIFDSGWTYRKKITIDNANVDADLTNFPVFIKLNADADIGDNAQNDGDDIRFTSSDGITLLKYEEESWTGGAGADATANFWVKVPTVATAADTDIYIYYSKAGAADNQDAANVWDSNYLSVHHLGEASGTLFDATASNNDLSAGNTPTYAQTGKIANAMSFDRPSSEYLEKTSATVPTAYPLTLDAWVKLADTSLATSEDRVVVSVAKKSGLEEFWVGYFNRAGTKELRTVTQGGGTSRELSYPMTLDTNWHHIVGVFTNSTTHAIYIDGAVVSGTPVGAATTPSAVDTLYVSGLYYNTSNFYGGMNGSIDEVRVSNTNRSAAWVKFEYNNMSAADNELTFSAQGTENTSPNIPVLVSPGDASVTSDTTPTLSATYTDPDAGDSGQTNYRISSSTLADCTNNVNIVSSGSSLETADEDETTSWTPGSAIGANVSYTWCAQNNDGTATSVWTEMGSFTLDAATPDIVAVDAGASSGDRTSLTSDAWLTYSDTGSDDQLSFSWTDPSSVSDDTFFYELNANAGGTVTGDETNTSNPFIDSITVAEGTNYFHVRPRNGATTWGTERTFTVKYDKTAPAVNAGADTSKKALFTQNATTSDATSGIGSYQWSKVSGPGTVTFGTATAEDTTVTTDTDGSYVLRLTVTDTAGLSASDDVTLTWDTEAPSVEDDVPSLWQTADITVTLTCSDGTGVGCAKVYYTTDGTAPTTGSSSVDAASSWQFTYATEGTALLKYRGEDTLANLAATQTAANALRLDKTAPTVLQVSSDTANGSYAAGDTIDIDLTFSEAVTSSGEVTVTLETGVTDQSCTMTLSGASTGTCTYTVQAGDASADLTVKTIAGTISDAAGNPMTNFVPATNLAASKALIIDTGVATFSDIAVTVGETTAQITWTTSEATTTQAQYGLTNLYGTLLTETDTDPRVTSHAVSLTGLECGGTYHYQVRGRDAAENQGASDDGTFTTIDCIEDATSVTGGGGGGGGGGSPGGARSPGMLSRIAQAQSRILALYEGKRSSRREVVEEEERELAARDREERIRERIAKHNAEIAALERENAELAKEYAEHREERLAQTLALRQERLAAERSALLAATKALKREQEANERQRTLAAQEREERFQSRIAKHNAEIAALERERDALAKEYARNREERLARSLFLQEQRLAAEQAALIAEKEALDREREEQEKRRAERIAQGDQGTEPTHGSAPLTPSPEVIATRRNRLLTTIGGVPVIFADVSDNAWYTPYVSYLVEEQIATGYVDDAGNPKGEFGVGNAVTRAEVLKMALEAAGKAPDPSLKVAPENRSARGTWAAAYVKQAEDMGIGIFRTNPDIKAPATRGEVIQVILDAMGFVIGKTTSTFDDVPADHPYSRAIALAAFNGFIEGDRGTDGQLLNRFRPDDPINRAEVAKIIALVREVAKE